MRKLGWYNRTVIERAPRGIHDIHNAAFLLALASRLFGFNDWPWWPFIVFLVFVFVLDVIKAIEIVFGGPDKDL